MFKNQNLKELRSFIKIIKLYYYILVKKFKKKFELNKRK